MRILARTGPALLSEPLGSTSSQTKLSLLITMDLFAFKRLSEQTKALLRQEEKKYKQVSLPYFGVKLSCVCLMFALDKKVMTYSYPKVTYSEPKVTHSDPTHLPLPPRASPDNYLAISEV